MILHISILQWFIPQRDIQISQLNGHKYKLLDFSQQPNISTYFFTWGSLKQRLPLNLCIKNVKEKLKVFSVLWMYGSSHVPISTITEVLVNVCRGKDHITMSRSVLKLYFLMLSLSSGKPETTEYFQTKHRSFPWVDFRTVILWIIKCKSCRNNLYFTKDGVFRDSKEKPFPPSSSKF